MWPSSRSWARYEKDLTPGLPDLFSTRMKRIGANNAAIVTGVGPVSTILQAHFFPGEKIFAGQIIDTVLVIIGVWLVGWKANKKCVFFWV